MIILNKKRLLAMISMVCVAIFAFSFQIAKEEKTVATIALPVSNKVIVIDAGHGGAERGAISCLGNDEKDINLKIALFLFEELSKKGADIYMTRFTDEFVSLDDRVKYAHDKKADI